MSRPKSITWRCDHVEDSRHRGAGARGDLVGHEPAQRARHPVERTNAAHPRKGWAALLCLWSEHVGEPVHDRDDESVRRGLTQAVREQSVRTETVGAKSVSHDSSSPGVDR